MLCADSLSSRLLSSVSLEELGLSHRHRRDGKACDRPWCHRKSTQPCSFMDRKLSCHLGFRSFLLMN